MGLYADYIFPMGFDYFMERSRYLIPYRQNLLKDVKGEILEIGFGTGLNLPHYPPGITEIHTVDPNPGLGKKALKRINLSNITVNHHTISSENLPFEDASFDTITCSWTLCSIADIEKALEELNRILKPDGRFYFIEHGLSRDEKVMKWQNRLNPIQKIWAVGCHLNRDMKNIIGRKMKMLEIKEFYIEQEAKTHGFTYQGVATKKL